jgi:hypothetical protein
MCRQNGKQFQIGGGPFKYRSCGIRTNPLAASQHLGWNDQATKTAASSISWNGMEAKKTRQP